MAPDRSLDAAECENLSVEGLVRDLTAYRSNGTFDAVVLDRVVHMFRDPGDKVALLAKAARATADRGYVLIADTPSNQQYIEAQFGDREVWTQAAGKKGRRIFKRVVGID